MRTQPGRRNNTAVKTWRATFAAGMLAAVLGFSFALATSSREAPGSASRGAASRRVGVDLRFTNPFLASNPNAPGFDPTYPSGGDVGGDPDGFDLGDVAAGSVMSRYINVAGGLKPYSFTLAPLLGSVGNPGGPALPIVIPSLSAAGKITATLPMNTAGATVLRFDIDVMDAIATERSGRFKLNLLPRETSFRHAQARIPFALRGDTYHTKLEVVGGAPPYRYNVVPGSVFFNGKPQGRLEDIGVTLAEDGTIFGRPLVEGSLDFTVRATDATFVPALSRNTNRTDETYNLTVQKNDSANTEIAAGTCQIRGNTIVAGGDSLSYRGVIDLKGDVLETLAGAALTLRIGGAAYSGTLNDKGRLALRISDTGQLSISIGRNGTLNIKLSGADLNAALGAANFADAVDQSVILFLEVGKLRTAEVLTMRSSVRNGKYSLSYTLGKAGASQGGAFQILSVSGADGRIDDEDGDRWLVKFLGVPRALDGAAATDIVSKASKVTIRIGDAFSQQVTVALLSTRLGFKGALSDKGVYQLYLDPKKFVHRLQTNVISSNVTDIPTAFVDPQLGDRNAPSIFPLGMDLTGFTGDTGRVIIRNNKSWKQR